MSKNIALCFAVFSIFIVSTSCVSWRSATISATVLARPEPAGFVDANRVLFVCRAYTDDRWISGRLDFADNAVSSCKVPVYGIEHNSRTFQILNSSPGETSWVPYTGNLPANAVKGGNHRNGSPGYVCRAPYEGSLTLGMSGMNGSVCYMTLDGREVHSQSSSSIEILVRNRYGVMTN